MANIGSPERIWEVTPLEEPVGIPLEQPIETPDPVTVPEEEEVPA
jgi:hypothetical protein